MVPKKENKKRVTPMSVDTADAECGFALQFPYRKSGVGLSGLTIEECVFERSSVNPWKYNGLQCMPAQARAREHLLQ
jgi:hypothetical protein